MAQHAISAASRRDAPGVYVDGAKIAALGLRVSRGYSYHGVALNVDLDLTPFSRINPCGFEKLPVTSLSELGVLQKLDATLQQSQVTETSQTPVETAGLALAEVFSAACCPAPISES